MHVREQATWFGRGTNLARWEVNVVVEHHLCELQVVTRDLEACGFVSEPRSERLDAHIVHVGSVVTRNVVRCHISRSENVVLVPVTHVRFHPNSIKIIQNNISYSDRGWKRSLARSGCLCHSRPHAAARQNVGRRPRAGGCGRTPRSLREAAASAQSSFGAPCAGEARNLTEPAPLQSACATRIQSVLPPAPHANRMAWRASAVPSAMTSSRSRVTRWEERSKRQPRKPAREGETAGRSTGSAVQARWGLGKQLLG
jgi:hypothetical protein